MSLLQGRDALYPSFIKNPSIRGMEVEIPRTFDSENKIEIVKCGEILELQGEPANDCDTEDQCNHHHS
jgi:hypothetical protein